MIGVYDWQEARPGDLGKNTVPHAVPKELRVSLERQLPAVQLWRERHLAVHVLLDDLDDLGEKLVLGEMKHRIKNTLATVQGMARQSLKTATVQERSSFIARLRSLADAHDLLTNEEWSRARLLPKLKALFPPLCICRIMKIQKASNRMNGEAFTRSEIQLLEFPSLISIVTLLSRNSL